MSDEHGQVRDEELDAEREARRRLALAQIRQWPDPVLKMRAGEVEVFDDDLRRLTERMASLMEDANGVGLAATQAGVVRRVFVFRREEQDEPIVAVNPRIVDPSEERLTDDEGCLSLQRVLVPVERHSSLTLEAQDVTGAPHSPRAEGPGRARRPARARPSGRRADPRAHDSRSPARGDGHAPPAADLGVEKEPGEVRLCGECAVRGRGARAAGRPARDPVRAHAAGRPSRPRTGAAPGAGEADRDEARAAGDRADRGSA